VTPLYPQKLALTSPTSGGRSIGIVRSRTKATECVFFVRIMVRLEVLGKLSKLGLSKGPNAVGDSLPLPEGGNRSNFQNVVFSSYF
jgi:hypothetical protein